MGELSCRSVGQNGTHWTSSKKIWNPFYADRQPRWKTRIYFKILGTYPFIPSKPAEWWKHLHILVNYALQFGLRPCVFKHWEWRLTSWMKIKWKIKRCSVITVILTGEGWTCQTPNKNSKNKYIQWSNLFLLHLFSHILTHIKQYIYIAMWSLLYYPSVLPEGKDQSVQFLFSPAAVFILFFYFT